MYAENLGIAKGCSKIQYHYNMHQCYLIIFGVNTFYGTWFLENISRALKPRAGIPRLISKTLMFLKICPFCN